MLVIPKKKLILTRVLVWCGLLIMLGGLVSALYLGKWAVSIVLAGGVVFTAGAYIKHELYRCPKCGEKLLAAPFASTFNVLFERCPKYCLNCSTEITVKLE